MIEIVCWVAAVLLFFDGQDKLGKVGQHGIGKFEMILAVVVLAIWLIVKGAIQIAKIRAGVHDPKQGDFD